MQHNNLDGILTMQNCDLFYFSGTAQESMLFIPAEGEPLLMVRKSFERATQETSLAHIVSLRRLDEIPKYLHNCDVEKLGVEMDVLPVSFFNRIKALFPQSSFFDASPLIRKVRMLKSAYEIDLIKQAGRMVDTALESVRDFLKPGLKEIELAAQVECVMRRMGHQGIIKFRRWNCELFYGHIASGSNSAFPSYLDSPTGGKGVSTLIPQGASNRRIKSKEPVLIDYVGAYKGYLADETRIFAINGLPRKLVNAHEACLKIKHEILRKLRKGVSSESIYTAAQDMARELGYANNFMGYNENRVAFVGHGIGLEIDELPVLGDNSSKIDVNMALALEPKIIFPKLGVVGIEDTFVITEDGPKPLTTVSEDIIVV